MAEVPKEIRVTVGGIAVKEVFQLKDGRMEIRWDPVDVVIPDELEYLSKLCDMNLSRTEAQASLRSDPVEYIFTREAYWEGLRCPKQIWGLFMKAKGFSDEAVDNFYKAWTKSPIKELIEKDLYAERVAKVAKDRPWEKQA